MYPSDKRPRLYVSGAAKKREKNRRLDNAVTGMSKIRSFYVTTTAGEDETSEGNPENCKRVALSVPAPEDKAAAEPAPEDEAAAEPAPEDKAAAEPAPEDEAAAEPAPEDKAAAEPAPEDKAAAEPAREDEAAAEPAPEDEAAAEPTPTEPATAEPALTEPTRRGPVVQELDLTLDNPTNRALFQLGTLPTELRTTIIHHGPCRRKVPFAISSENGNRKTLPCTFWGNVNRTATALLLASDEEDTLSKMLVVRWSIGNAKRVGQQCIGQPEELRSENQITRENPIAPWCEHRIRAMGGW